MPHLQIQYSQNLEERVNITECCTVLASTMAATGIFPLGGIRVRAHALPHYAIADGHPQNAFVDMVLRIGTGRSAHEIECAGVQLMADAERFFGEYLADGYFMLSLEVQEISEQFSWRTNSVHKRLQMETE